MTNGPATRHKQKAKAPLTRERIVETAFQLLDREGEGALSMRRLATALACEAMSIYHHVPGIEALSDALVDRWFEALDLPAAPVDAASALREAGRAFLATADRHPHVARLVVGRRWNTPLAFSRVRTMVDWYRSVGASDDESLRHARVLGAYLGGAASALSGWRLDAQRAAAQDAAPGVDAALWARSTKPQVQADLEAGLDWLLAAQLAALGRPPGPPVAR